MSTPTTPIILLVDDESGIIKSLQRLLNDLDAQIITASNGEEALKLAQKILVSLVISDQRMPGMSGVELLTRLRESHPDAIRILLTGYADLEMTVKAINSGAVRYYITKPWDDELLLSRIRESLELYQMTIDNQGLAEVTNRQNEELKQLNTTLEERVAQQTSEIRAQHEELSRSFMETIRAFSTIIELRLKDIGNHSQRVASLAKKLLAPMNLNHSEFQNIVVAAFLHDIGKISYPDFLLKKTENQYTKSDWDVVTKHPVLGQTCVFAISDFEEIGLIIRHHHENFNGTGYPDNLQGQRIPLGSRLIRIIDYFDHHAFSAKSYNIKTLNEAAADLVKELGILFDPELVKRFIALDAARQYCHPTLAETIIVRPIDLQNNMVVAENIYTNSGMLILPRGAKLSAEMIERIVKIDRFDQIPNGVSVYKTNELEGKKHESVQNTAG